MEQAHAYTVGLNVNEETRIMWQHPTGILPRSVLVTALGPTKHNLLEDTTRHIPDKRIMEVDEVWGINGGVNWFAGRVSYDLLWVMDHLEGERIKEPEYIQHLMRWIERHDAPVITSRAGGLGLETRIREYPLWEVEDFYNIKRPYFHNSIPYIVAYAGFIGVKQLVIYGADYSHESLKGREEDRPCAEYWIGRVEQMGVDVQPR